MTAKSSDGSSHPVSFESVFQKIRHWRANADRYQKKAGIPDELWGSIFELENHGYTPAELKRTLSLNTHQYNRKKQQLFQDSLQDELNYSKTSIEDLESVIDRALPSADFCEAKITTESKATIPTLDESMHTTSKTLSHLKSTQQKPEKYLDHSTIVVECIHPDGHRLKIHTTQAYIQNVMQAFFSKGVVAS